MLADTGNHCPTCDMGKDRFFFWRSCLTCLGISVVDSIAGQSLFDLFFFERFGSCLGKEGPGGGARERHPLEVVVILQVKCRLFSLPCELFDIAYFKQALEKLSFSFSHQNAYIVPPPKV